MNVVVGWQKRIARAEAMANKQLAELPEMQEQALGTAIANGDEETAAEIARTIRNRLLRDSDAEVAFDRLGLTVPSGTSFTAWLSFLRTLGKALTNDWATYRQALRDLPKQEGFPFDIQWPVSPANHVTKRDNHNNSDAGAVYGASGLNDESLVQDIASDYHAMTTDDLEAIRETLNL